MLLNYFKIALRNLLRHKAFSLINILGLGLGMACSLLIYLWVQDERSFDRFLPGVKEVYFVRVNSLFNGQITTSFVTPGPLSEAIAKDIPAVASVTKITFGKNLLIKVGEKSSKENGQYATPGFFGIFHLPVLAGNPAKALAQPKQIIITRKLADKYFPNESALGKIIQLNNDKLFTVGAVLENLPANASLQFDWLVNFQVQEQDWMKTWGNSTFMTYVRLKPNTIAAHAQAAMKGMYSRYVSPSEKDTHPILQPMTDLHLYGNYENGQAVGGQIAYVRIFSLVALFILLIACINFMNLATARSALRTKEIGVRKVVGASRPSLIGQFMAESILTSLLSVGVALLLVTAILPTFNTVFGKQLILSLAAPSLWLTIMVLVLAVGVVSGSYPALFLSAFRPIGMLKGSLQAGRGSLHLRQALIVFQFTMSVFLIVGMLVVGQQMDYLRTKNLGMDRENVLYVPLEGELEEGKRLETYRQELMRQPAIASATTAMSLPINIEGYSGDLAWPGKDPNLQTNVSAMCVGGDFTRTMNIPLVAGRDFAMNRPADSLAYLINEAAAKLMGMTDPVGKEVEFWQGKGPIIGVMKDFHLRSLHEKINPLVLVFNHQNTSFLLVKTKAGKTAQAIAELGRVTKQFNPAYPLTYHFLDEAYEQLYRNEQQVNTLINAFGVLAICISCLGLFGLAAFTAERRTKEIGIRKVLGASVTSIVALLSKDFLKLIALANIIAWPLAYYALHTWLQNFEYRIPIDSRLFGLAGVSALFIALLTVSFQAIKAAIANPVKSLRAE
ncbi:MAG: ABC transporter permease [Bacteroidota bacterium]